MRVCENDRRPFFSLPPTPFTQNVVTLDVLFLYVGASLSHPWQLSAAHRSSPILDSHGFRVSVLESLTFRYIADELASLGNWRSKFGCIIFTSQRAVEAFKQRGFEGSPSDLCFVVGPATGGLASEIGFEPKGSHCGTASSLAEFIIEQYGTGYSKPALFLTGAKHSSLLPQRLRDNGIEVEEKIVYVAVPNPNLPSALASAISERHGQLCIVFFSPSAVTLAEPGLRSPALPDDLVLKLVAIGPTTAQAITQAGLSVSGVCSSPTPDAVLTLIKELHH
nr:unnamed protein product [Spirometra erinaceieuropaei]